MKITICGSIESVNEIQLVSEELNKKGHVTDIPFTCQRILNGELTLEEFKREKEKNGDGAFRKIQDDVIKRYYNIIRGCDAILVMNVEKKGIAGYIGGNTFLEMGFAHVLDKKIFVMNPLPEIGYLDELMAMKTIVLKGNLSLIK